MTKQVQLSDAAYARLAAQKRQGESFSDVVLRITQRRSLAELLPRVTEQEARSREAMMKEMHRLDLADAERSFRRGRR